MVAKAVVKTSGGNRLRAFVRSRERAIKASPVHVVEVGFDDARISPLAANLEYGNPKTNLPERPAFRHALPDIRREARKVAAQEIRRAGGVLDHAGAVRVAVAARDVLRTAYLNFHGPGLSERQQQRKAGTSFASQELVGGEGPKLVERIAAFVDGQEVG